MRQTWHIFLKDARRLRYDILVTLAITAAFAWCTAHRTPIHQNRVDQAAQLLTGVLLLAWWYLVARAIYGEAPAGDRQFWVTKPYRWTSLLGAKFLFIAVFITLPFLLSDCAILALQGFHLSDHLAGIAWHPLVSSAVFLLPAAALACITVNLTEMALTSLGITLVDVLFAFRIVPADTPWDQNPDWVMNSLVLLLLLFGAASIMILQYRSRRTGLSRIFVGAALAFGLMPFSLLPWNAGRALRPQPAKTPADATSVSLQFQPGGHPPAKPKKKMYTDNRAAVILPIAFSGVPSGQFAVVDDMEGKLELPDGEVSEAQPMGESGLDKSWSFLLVEPGLYGRVKNTPLGLHVTLLLTLYGNPHTESMPVEAEGDSHIADPHRVPGIGICEEVVSDTETFARCFVPFRLPGRTLAQVDSGTPVMGNLENLDSPFPASLGISPMEQPEWVLPKQEGATVIVFTTVYPVAHIRRELDIPNVRLADFAY